MGRGREGLQLETGGKRCGGSNTVCGGVEGAKIILEEVFGDRRERGSGNREGAEGEIGLGRKGKAGRTEW
jgi:hypothetical protein